MPYTWAQVQKGQVADSGAINALGAAVASHDASITVLAAAAMAYSARQVISVATATVTFSAIPTTLKRMRLTWAARGDTVAQVVTMFLQIGGDVGANYSYTQTQNRASTITGSSSHLGTSLYLGITTAASATATWYGSGDATFTPWDNNIAGTLGYRFGSEAMGTTTADHYEVSGGGNYSGTNGRTSISIAAGAGNIVAGDFQLEGW